MPCRLGLTGNRCYGPPPCSRLVSTLHPCQRWTLQATLAWRLALLPVRLTMCPRTPPLLLRVWRKQQSLPAAKMAMAPN